jgi:hypothetical protein
LIFLLSRMLHMIFTHSIGVNRGIRAGINLGAVALGYQSANIFDPPGGNAGAKFDRLRKTAGFDAGPPGTFRNRNNCRDGWLSFGIANNVR